MRCNEESIVGKGAAAAAAASTFGLTSTLIFSPPPPHTFSVRFLFTSHFQVLSCLIATQQPDDSPFRGLIYHRQDNKEDGRGISNLTAKRKSFLSSFFFIIRQPISLFAKPWRGRVFFPYFICVEMRASHANAPSPTTWRHSSLVFLSVSFFPSIRTGILLAFCIRPFCYRERGRGKRVAYYRYNIYGAGSSSSQQLVIWRKKQRPAAASGAQLQFQVMHRIWMGLCRCLGSSIYIYVMLCSYIYKEKEKNLFGRPHNSRGSALSLSGSSYERGLTGWLATNLAGSMRPRFRRPQCVAICAHVTVVRLPDSQKRNYTQLTDAFAIDWGVSTNRFLFTIYCRLMSLSGQWVERALRMRDEQRG